ncbi:hypothetical protein BCh11DRAFT_07858 [Burkholderia sp. Ch1-1]|nr:hypothetical protein BCh11DRAFT_07858 [Burkholderia sp. Ch1-1]
MAVSSAVAGRQGRIHLGSRQAVGQLGPQFWAGVSNKSRASACVSQPGSGQAGSQGGPPYRVAGIVKSRASACASQPGSGQAGGQDGPFVAGGKQGNGVIASSSLWQAGA